MQKGNPQAAMNWLGFAQKNPRLLQTLATSAWQIKKNMM